MQIVLHRRLPHRCTKCEARHTFSRKWDTFDREKHCRVCGHRRFFVDQWMRRRGRQQKCNCGGYWFPHRKRSKYCYENPQAELYWAERMNDKQQAA